jgi:SAM-dependent methyltransferase
MPETRARLGCAWCGASLRDGERLAGRVRCARCGVSTTDPWPSEEELELAYAGAYRPVGGRFAGSGDAILRRTRASLARRLDRIAPPGPILDVGAGDGSLLDALRARGREATGVERSAARRDVVETDLRELEGRWAGIVFWHSLEHLPEPGLSLERAAELLGPRGAMVIAVPNADSVQAAIFGERWFALDPPRHLVHLTSEALRRRLELLDLSIERVSYLRGGQVVFGWLDGMVGAQPGHPSLYDAIRRPEARFGGLAGWRRAATLLAAALLLLPALAAAAAEVLARRGGTVYVEARATRW